MDYVNGIYEYKKSIRLHHKSRLIRQYFSVYTWLWYNTEFWLEPVDRRPFTYIIRDFYHAFPVFYSSIIFLIGYLIGYFANLSWWIVIAFYLGIIGGHLFWGAAWKKGEQEWPPYIQNN
jgi:hypothetical protein